MPKRAVRSGQRRTRQESPQRRNGRKLYEARTRAVQRLVAFRVPAYDDASEYWRKKVHRYHRYLFGAEGQPGIAQGVKAKVTRRNKIKLTALQKQVGQGALPGIKYAFVPTVIDPQTGVPEPVRVIERNGMPTIIMVGDTSHWVEAFDIQALLRDPIAEIERVLVALDATNPYGDAAARYRIMNGGGSDDTKTLPTAYTRREVPNAVMALLTRYGSGSSVVRRLASRWWGNWLYGLQIHVARNQRTLREYANAQEIERERVKRVRKVNTKWTYLLEALRDQGGHAPTEPLAHRTTGSTTDATVLPAMKELRKRGLVTGDDNRWSITSKGRDYLRQALDVLDRFNR